MIFWTCKSYIHIQNIFYICNYTKLNMWFKQFLCNGGTIKKTSTTQFIYHIKELSLTHKKSIMVRKIHDNSIPSNPRVMQYSITPISLYSGFTWKETLDPLDDRRSIHRFLWSCHQPLSLANLRSRCLRNVELWLCYKIKRIHKFRYNYKIKEDTSGS